MNKVIEAVFNKYFLSNLKYLRGYNRAVKIIGDKAEQREQLFNKLIAESQDKKCLQIGVRKTKYFSNWISVDLYDHSNNIDYNYDINDLKFKENTFDIIVCNAVLEHVETPIKAIKELYRVLKNNGVIWVEVPFNQPYHPSPHDYWRVTLSGLKIWMDKFIEISSGFFRINKSSIHTGIFFYGKK